MTGCDDQAMRLHLTTAYRQGVALEYLRECARRDVFGVHEAVDDPEAADAILFVENAEFSDPFYRRLRSHELVRRSGPPAFMYNEVDFPYCALPGLYASMPGRAFDPRRQVAFPYLFRPNEDVARIACSGARPDLLFSFMGARNHPLRKRVLALAHPRAHIEDTHAFSIWARHAPEEVARRKARFADVMARSAFVLCPRGAGTSSYRLFETMEAARVPVLISDQWVPTRGPDWSFAIRVREADVETIPALLEALEPEALDRGCEGRRAWERWCAPEVAFHHAAEAIADLRRCGFGSNPRWLPDPEYLRLRAMFTVRRCAKPALELARRLNGVPPGR